MDSPNTNCFQEFEKLLEAILFVALPPSTFNVYSIEINKPNPPQRLEPE
jgi:hypothetical protein